MYVIISNSDKSSIREGPTVVYFQEQTDMLPTNAW